MKKFIFLLAVAVTSVWACRQKVNVPESAQAQNDKMADVNDDSEVKDDYDFAVEAADGNLLQVQLAELAMKKAKSREVRELGKSVSNWHTQSNDELRKVAHQKNVVLPNSLSKKSQKTFDNLDNTDGEDFDRQYTELMIQEHEDEIASFQKESKTGKDPDFKSFASDNIEALHHHAEMSKSLKSAQKK